MSITQTRPKHVVTNAGLQELLESGWQLHVVCQKKPELKGYQWHGSWYLVAVDPSTNDWAPLITAREKAKLSKRPDGARPMDAVSYREIKTISGLVSMVTSFGFKYVAFPTEPGTSLVLQPELS